MSEEQTPTTEQEEEIIIHLFNVYESRDVTVAAGTTIAEFLQGQNIASDKFQQFQGQQGVGLLSLMHNDVVTLSPSFPHQVLTDGDRVKILPAAQKGG